MEEEEKSKTERNLTKATEDDPLEEAFESAPPEARKFIKRQMMVMGQMQMSDSPASEIMKKLTEEHITSYLEASKENMQKSYEDKNYQRLFLLGGAIIVVVFVLLISLLLKDSSPDLLEKVLTNGGALLVGLLGGYGFGKSRRDDGD